MESDKKISKKISKKNFRKILILNYHNVGEPAPAARYKRLYVSQRHLSIHISFLKKLGYQFLTLNQAFEASSLSERVACITFDDGYVDNFELGLPVLRMHGVPATIFVVSESVGASTKAWIESGTKHESALMSWSQILELEAHGWEIGSHCSEHVHLDRRNIVEQQRLIDQSFETFATHLKKPVSSFAYPYGAYNQSTLDALAKSKFKRAVTTAPGLNTAETPAYELKRIAMGGRKPHHLIGAIFKILFT